MQVLVIGADGFAGRWLVRHLAESGDQVTALAGPRFSPPLEGAQLVERVDVRDAARLSEVIRRAAPDVVFYLAGVSAATLRDDLPVAVGVTLRGSLNAFEACADLANPTRFLFVSTGYVYRGGDLPVGEASPLRPSTTYAATKLAAEQALLTLSERTAVDVIVARPFNHIGPGQADAFLVPTLARQVTAVALPQGPAIIKIADPSVVRDFTDVRDVVHAYRLIATEAAPGDIFNVASGQGLTVTELAERLAAVAGVRVRVEASGEHDRVDEDPIVVGDPSRLEALGWTRSYTLEVTLADIIRSQPAPAAG
jgi:GDP-4-dehydro-6-deoxy-D-mannose reductase